MNTTNHTKEWWEGYNCQFPKCRNPHAAGQPWLAEFPDRHLIRKCKDWDEGWEARFYQEDP